MKQLQGMSDWTQRQANRIAGKCRELAIEKPVSSAIVLMAAGMLAAAAMNSAGTLRLQATLAEQDARLDETRREAQRELNALAARLGELQAQANRLNALGDRLTRVAKLGDGEFDFNRPVGVGGADASRDIAASELREGLGGIDQDFQRSGSQLSVLDALLFDQKLVRDAMPSRAPVANSFITSGYGHRADPFGGGSQYHRGIDFDARTGDPVMTVADGVVSYSGWRSGYGNVVEVDHGNGFVTRYAHNSRNTVKVGDLVRVGQEVAKAGSTGRSTGAHVHFEVWENGRVHNPRKFLGEIEARRM
jgi:murein DD-endopeptidase MepM/ murein hydrolase activator NlpD